MSKPVRQCAALVALLCLAVLAVMAMGASGLLSNESVIGGLAAVSLLFLAVLKWVGRFSSIYVAVVSVGSLGLMAVACLPGSWGVAGLPLLGLSGIAIRALERKGWDRA